MNEYFNFHRQLMGYEFKDKYNRKIPRFVLFYKGLDPEKLRLNQTEYIAKRRY